MQKFIVSRDDSIYEAWPDVVLCDSGKLLCVFTECVHHGDRDQSRIVYCFSTNRGRTWSKKFALTERTNKDAYYNNARISKLPDGRLVIVCDFIVGGNETINRDYRMRMWFSENEGETWSEPVLTPVIGYVPNKLFVMKSGRWVLAAQQRDIETNRLAQFMRYSDDEGKSWSELITVGADDRYNLCEASIIEPEPDVLVCYMRENSGKGYDCFKSISHDGGKTWEGVYNVPLPGCHRPTSGITRDGRILITYRFMQGGKGWLGAWTQNTFGAFLQLKEAVKTERGEQSARIFPLDFDRSSVSDCGYTGWVQFDDGEFYVVNYIVDDAPKAQIRGYSMRADEFYIEQREYE